MIICSNQSRPGNPETDCAAWINYLWPLHKTSHIKSLCLRLDVSACACLWKAAWALHHIMSICAASICASSRSYDLYVDMTMWHRGDTNGWTVDVIYLHISITVPAHCSQQKWEEQVLLQIALIFFFFFKASWRHWQDWAVHKSSRKSHSRCWLSLLNSMW